ncbi:LysR family transcriptional regulator [Rhizobium lentis]|uniref:HTH-type transcriptional regulator TtuA n=1 Tax=Rhizobium lentis TaxID=1138194 RepID=A0A9Q3M818_9HYPH|nr:LysR family transcriptional regulator [Rhizobium lentis]MBX4975118.1 LysR family transcriptional regulator [Rhizobium lentis]MBX4987296.1 LysR family transcriptional regulator [Rhizobium lentis]MBX4997267.1 LysR family transcriptional regulator [Rhizobium lentis]MBX5005740.1 LysR family transcriptional regulator [Rhizobium lentis]
MDIRTLACFVAVAEDLHFRRAAERMNLTQPALSQRIRALEGEVGADLFERDRRGVALTPAGAAFLGPAREAVRHANMAKAEALRAVRGEVGRLRLGFTPIAFYGVLPEAVQAFRIRHPQVEVDLIEMSSPKVEAALASADIDLGVLHPPVSRDLILYALPDEPFVLALPATHRLAEQAVIRVADLAHEPLLIAPRSIGPSIYDRVIALFTAEGISPRIVQEVTPMTTLVGLVAAGTGLGFVTSSIGRATRPGVAYRPVLPPPPSLPIAAAWHPPTLSASGERFLEVVRVLVEQGEFARAAS